MHRVAYPDNGMAGVRHGRQQRRQQLRHLVGAHPRDDGQPAGRAVGVEHLAQRDQVGRRRAGTGLDADRVVDAREELDVGAVQLSRAVADPEHVGRAVVPVAGQRVAAGQALLVVEQQAFVARPDVDLVQLPLRRQVDPAGRHEAQRPLDLGGDRLVAPALRRRGDELLVPEMHLGEVGEAALGECPQQVERRSGLVVALQHPLGVERPRRGRGLVAVQHVPAERRQLDAVHQLRRAGARLDELPGDAADLDHRQHRAVRQHRRHLQDDLQPLADADRREVREGLCAVAGL